MKTLTFDDIVVSGGRTPRDVSAYAGAAPIVEDIGDCVKVANIKGATYTGYKAAMKL
jgi:hypothetical protein